MLHLSSVLPHTLPSPPSHSPLSPLTLSPVLPHTPSHSPLPSLFILPCPPSHSPLSSLTLSPVLPPCPPSHYPPSLLTLSSVRLFSRRRRRRGKRKKRKRRKMSWMRRSTRKPSGHVASSSTRKQVSARYGPASACARLSCYVSPLQSFVSPV